MSAQTVPQSLPPEASAQKPFFHTPYIVSKTYDWCLFLGPPLASLMLGIFVASISGITTINDDFELWGEDHSIKGILLGTLIHAHLVIVFARSHGNNAIFQTHPFRFALAPILLLYGMLSSDWIFAIVSVLATFWDVYHSGLQTFGFARIYDARAGNPPDQGRRLDLWLNQLLYAGPILAGATMLDHFGDFETDFGAIDSPTAEMFTRIPAWMEGHQGYFTWTILIGGTLFLIYYIMEYRRLWQNGAPISMQKVYLLASTGFCSIITWGFNTWDEAFLIMNVFHAVQYFGIVWNAEKRTLQKTLRVDGWRYGKAVALATLLVFAFAYGGAVELSNSDNQAWVALTLVVSIMHFWYDGFIWSVRRKQV